MKLAAIMILFGFVFAIPAGASGTTPKKWYWTESRAETVVLTKVKIPMCRAIPDDKVCGQDGKPLPGHPNLYGFSLGNVRCSGSDELGSTFRFARFSCRVISSYPPYFRETIAVYPTGRATFHWKFLG